MGSKVSVLESCANSWQPKVCTLVQEMVRRLNNTQVDLIEHKLDILNTYSRKLLKYGHNNAQCIARVTSGVVG